MNDSGISSIDHDAFPPNCSTEREDFFPFSPSQVGYQDKVEENKLLWVKFQRTQRTAFCRPQEKRKEKKSIPALDRLLTQPNYFCPIEHLREKNGIEPKRKSR
jgi:hypothetical protein